MTSLVGTFPLVLGTNVFGWTADEATAHSILDAFVAEGGDHIDTSDSYSALAPLAMGGQSESIIGTWLSRRGHRDDVTIATKVGFHPEFKGLAPGTIAAAVDLSLTRLKTDHIDLYYAHYDDPDRDIEEIAESFNRLVVAGKVRHIGVSNTEPGRIRSWVSASEANGWAKPVALQAEYNLLARREFESKFAPLADELGLGVFTYFSLAAGLLTGKYRSPAEFEGMSRARHLSKYDDAATFRIVDSLIEIADAINSSPSAVALAWLRGKATVAAPVASARSVNQLSQLIDAGKLALPDEHRALLDAVSE